MGIKFTRSERKDGFPATPFDGFKDVSLVHVGGIHFYAPPGSGRTSSVRDYAQAVVQEGVSLAVCCDPAKTGEWAWAGAHTSGYDGLWGTDGPETPRIVLAAVLAEQERRLETLNRSINEPYKHLLRRMPPMLLICDDFETYANTCEHDSAGTSNRDMVELILRRTRLTNIRVICVTDTEHLDLIQVDFPSRMLWGGVVPDNAQGSETK